ncbi:hypothetical protein [Nitrobacter sp.]|uniref:hypothetical protein n=1 Tax=Nitrobacter sp. TaxID=29420 RepID=UPI0032201C52
MTPAERQRLYRARRRRGDVVTRAIAVPAISVETLIDAGFLAEWNADDPAAVARAIEALLRSLRTVTA